MEALIVILIVVFLALNGRKKQARSGAPARAAKPDREALERMRQAAREKLEAIAAAEGATPVADMSPEAREARRRELEARRAARQQAKAEQAARVPLGASILDEEGCVGGSMAHDHAEGESREEHGRHVEAVKRREASELLERAEAERRRAVNTGRLRQAVVMAEVLDRPVALRPRGYGRRAS